MTSLDRFSRYHHIWRKDREDAMRKYDALNDENFIPDCHHRELMVCFFFFLFCFFFTDSFREVPCFLSLRARLFSIEIWSLK